MIGKSSDYRSIMHIEFTDTKFNYTSVVPKTPWSYHIKSESYKSVNPYDNMSKESWKRYLSFYGGSSDDSANTKTNDSTSCQKLFQK